MSNRRIPKWRIERDAPQSTRQRSEKTESKLAKAMKGKLTINSGATFGQNDIIADWCEIEAKTTSKESFSVTLKDWEKLVDKCNVKKIPLFMIDFEGKKNREFVVMNVDDLKMILSLIEK